MTTLTRSPAPAVPQARRLPFPSARCAIVTAACPSSYGRGEADFFLPGISALRYLAQLRQPDLSPSGERDLIS